MEIFQKKGSNRYTFTFKDDVVNFAYKDKSGSGDADIRYADFPKKCLILIEQNEWLRNVGFLWIFVGVVQIGFAITYDDFRSGVGFWLLVGIICVVWSYSTKITNSVFKTDHANVFVIQDSKHDQIVSELQARRRAQLLEWYGQIDFRGDRDKETAKFNWLLEEGILSQQETDIKLAEIEAAFSDTSEKRH